MSQTSCNFCIIVPFYNEKGYLKLVAEELRKTDYPVIYIDDGSDDNSRGDVIDDYTIGYYPNQGKGHAVRYGAEEAIKRGYEWILVMDSDGQSPVELVANFIQTVKDNPETKIIIGNRLEDPYPMPILRFITNTFMSMLISMLAKQDIPDTQCGFRMIHKSVFNLPLYSNRFEFESEMLIKAGKAGMKIKSIPIPCIYEEGRISKIRPIKDMIKFIKMLIKLQA